MKSPQVESLLIPSSGISNLLITDVLGLVTDFVITDFVELEIDANSELEV
jgi:hypothetical protein